VRALAANAVAAAVGRVAGASRRALVSPVRWRALVARSAAPLLLSCCVVGDVSAYAHTRAGTAATVGAHAVAVARLARRPGALTEAVAAKVTRQALRARGAAPVPVHAVVEAPTLRAGLTSTMAAAYGPVGDFSWTLVRASRSSKAVGTHVAYRTVPVPGLVGPVAGASAGGLADAVEAARLDEASRADEVTRRTGVAGVAIAQRGAERSLAARAVTAAGDAAVLVEAGALAAATCRREQRFAGAGASDRVACAATAAGVRCASGAQQSAVGAGIAVAAEARPVAAAAAAADAVIGAGFAPPRHSRWHVAPK
jgi:hypothetical protein